jgi:Fe-S oxidoreductase
VARTSLRLVEPAPVRRLDADIAETFFACTGCRRCEEACDLGHDVSDTLWQARAAAAESGLLPAGAHALVERFVREGHAGGPALASATAGLDGTDADDASSTALLPGCLSPVDAPSTVTATLSAARALGAPLKLLRAPLCCGRPLRDAGARDTFQAHLAALRSRVGRHDLVVPSPACAEALTTGAAEVGLPLDGEVLHVGAYLARRLGQVPPGPSTAVVWHEPCQVAHDAEVRKTTRRLLETVSDGVRAPSSEGCCGAGGLLPETFPDASRAMAMEEADELRAAGAGLVAVAAPECRRALTAAGLEVVDVVELVARRLCAAGGPPA